MLSPTTSRQALCRAARSTHRTITTSSRTTPSFLRRTQLHYGSITPTLRPLSTTSLLRSTPMAAPTDAQAEAIQSSTGITPESLSETLKSSDLQPSHVDIQDISGGCGASFAAVIVSDAFQGKSALQRHRLVNGILKDEIRAIHAWTPRCLTQEQWEKEKAKLAGQ